MRRIWPDALDASQASDAMSAALTRSVYLQQDLVRQFIDADSDRDRFDVLSELVGAGRVGELYLQLEQSKKAWTAATNTQARDLEPLRNRLASLQSQLQRAHEHAEHETSESWGKWWDEAHAAGVDVPAGEADSSQAPNSLDSALRQLDVLSRGLHRQLIVIDELLAASVPASAPDLPELETLLERRKAASAELEAAQTRLAAARDRAATVARSRHNERDRDRQLSELAKLALSHLDERCPVCTQPYDREHTLEHLHELIARTQSVEPAATDEGEDDLSGLAASVTRGQATLAGTEADVELHQSASARAAAAEGDRERRLAQLGLDMQSDQAALQEARTRLSERLQTLERLRPEGEQLALDLARRAEATRREELEREARQLGERTGALESEVAERNATGDLAQDLLEAIRSAAAEVVGLQLHHLEPLLQRIYARMDPHPSLRHPSLRSWTERGRGRLRTSLSDPAATFGTDRPETVLSSSQLNAFAVATFLTLNMGVSRLPLGTAMLDDPLQSLDDVNLLGLVDVLRRIKQRRQLVISTHDSRFGGLLERKLRALDGQRSVRIDLEGWSRQGPVVKQRDIPGERRPLRIVA
jgi:DNA repair exonuclease SbcCD ATPase subunit